MTDTKIMERLADIVPRIFQFDRLERLSRYHPILAMSYMSLIYSINAILTATEEIEIVESQIWIFKWGVTTFPPDIAGKLAAMSAAYMKQIATINDLMKVGVLGALAEGIGFDMAEMYKDTINSLSKIIIAQTKETGKLIRLTPEIIKALTVAGITI